MEIFQGQPARPGVAIAAAARLSSEYGVPTLDPQRLRKLGERLRRFGMEAAESDQIILIADRVPPGFLGVPIPGLDVVGVATQGPPDPHGAFSVPTVCSLGDSLLDLISEDDIVIIDADRGRVYVEPDAVVLARYQSPVRRSRRFFLGGASLPARTASDNRVVAVTARARALSDVSRAMEAGADGVLIPADNDFLGGESLFQTSDGQQEALGKVMGVLGGQPLLLHVPPDRLALSALARAAADGALHLILDDPARRAEMAERLEQIEGMLDDQDILYGTLQIEAGVATPDAAAPESLDAYAGVCVTLPLDRARMDQLLPLAGLAQRAHKPLTLALPEGDDGPAFLADALALGAARLVTSIESVGAVKDAVRLS